jgi:hypothetical protein
VDIKAIMEASPQLLESCPCTPNGYQNGFYAGIEDGAKQAFKAAMERAAEQTGQVSTFAALTDKIGAWISRGPGDWMPCFAVLVTVGMVNVVIYDYYTTKWEKAGECDLEAKQPGKRSEGKEEKRQPECHESEDGEKSLAAFLESELGVVPRGNNSTQAQPENIARPVQTSSKSRVQEKTSSRCESIITGFVFAATVIFAATGCYWQALVCFFMLPHIHAILALFAVAIERLRAQWSNVNPMDVKVVGNNDKSAVELTTSETKAKEGKHRNAVQTMQNVKYAPLWWQKLADVIWFLPPILIIVHGYWWQSVVYFVIAPFFCYYGGILVGFGQLGGPKYEAEKSGCKSKQEAGTRAKTNVAVAVIEEQVKRFEEQRVGLREFVVKRRKERKEAEAAQTREELLQQAMRQDHGDWEQVGA